MKQPVWSEIMTKLLMQRDPTAENVFINNPYIAAINRKIEDTENRLNLLRKHLHKLQTSLQQTKSTSLGTGRLKASSLQAAKIYVVDSSASDDESIESEIQDCTTEIQDCIRDLEDWRRLNSKKIVPDAIRVVKYSLQMVSTDRSATQTDTAFLLSQQSVLEPSIHSTTNFSANPVHEHTKAFRFSAPKEKLDNSDKTLIWQLGGGKWRDGSVSGAVTVHLTEM
jgi:hypothetical protein